MQLAAPLKRTGGMAALLERDITLSSLQRVAALVGSCWETLSAGDGFGNFPDEKWGTRHSPDPSRARFVLNVCLSW
jgi:hypothetical protein